MEKQIIVYEPNEQMKMEVKTDGETVWLTQDQMCRLFGRNQSVISRHISNIFKEGELPKEGYMQILHITSPKGGRPTTVFYNLDVVISVGYRVKSFEGTRFRQWATRALRSGRALLCNNNSKIPPHILKNIMDAIEARHEDIVSRWTKHFDEIRYFC